MKKSLLFALAAVTVMGIGSAPMTAHAAALSPTCGGSCLNGCITSCGGQTSAFPSLLNQLYANGVASGCQTDLRCSGNFQCEAGTACIGSEGCGFVASRAADTCSTGWNCNENQCDSIPYIMLH